MQEELYDQDGNVIGYDPIYEVFERVVEDSPFGDGSYLSLAKTNAADGRWFGFDQKRPAIKRAKYINKGQFRHILATIPTMSLMPQSIEDYSNITIPNTSNEYDAGALKVDLNVYASIDFAYSKNQQQILQRLSLLNGC
jgi:hypothetical protein